MLATFGIVFAPGRAGTLQEMFQDAAQNYHHEEDEPFCPMVFFDTKYWRETLPVEKLLEQLFSDEKRQKEYQARVLFTDSVDEAVEFLMTRGPSLEAGLKRLMALGVGPAMRAALDERRPLDIPENSLKFAVPDFGTTCTMR